MSSTFSRAAVAAGLLVSGASAVYNAASTQNIAVYWGQGDAQIPLSDVCSDPSVDIVNIAFVNGFPQKVGDYPKTNFGNACWGYYPDPNDPSKDSGLLKNCAGVGDAITACQAAGKKVLLSLGGGYPTDYYLPSQAVAEDFADFLSNVFGVAPAGWTGPRPFGNAAVDGFDLDLEADAASLPSPDYLYLNYDYLVTRIKLNRPTALISAAPQCVVPDARLAYAIKNVPFDMIFTQFYNTDICSAAQGYKDIKKSTTTFTFDAWAQWLNTNSKNKDVKLYLGLPAGTDGLPVHKDHYLDPQQANDLVTKYQKQWPAIFGGVMLWEATVSVRNKVYDQPFGYWMKAAVDGTFTSKYKPVVSSSSIVASSTRVSSTRISSSTRVSSTRVSSTLVSSSTRVASSSVRSSSVRASSTVRSSSAYVTSSAVSSSKASSSSIYSVGVSSSASPASSKASSSVYSVASSSALVSSSASPVSSKASSSVYSVGVSSSASPASSKVSSSVYSVASSSARVSSSVYSASSPAPASSKVSSSVYSVASSSAHVSSSAYSASSPAPASSKASSVYSVGVSSSVYSVASSSGYVESSSVYVPHPSESSSFSYPASSPSIVYPADTTKIIYPSTSSTPCTTSSEVPPAKSSSIVYPESTPEAASSSTEYPASPASSKGYPAESSSIVYPESTPEAASSTPCTTSSKGYPIESSSIVYPASTPEAATYSTEYPASPASSKGYPAKSSSAQYPASPASSSAYPAYPAESSTGSGYPAYPAESSKGSASYPSVTKKPEYSSYPTGTTTTVITTTYVDVCSTGLTTLTTTITKTVCSSCAKPTKEAEYPEGWTTSVYVDQTVTVTITKPIHPATDVPAYPSSVPEAYAADYPSSPKPSSVYPGSDKPVVPGEYPSKPEGSYPEESSTPEYPVEAATSTLVQYVTLTKVPVAYTPAPYASSAPYAPVPYGSTNATSAYVPQASGTGKPTKPSSYAPTEFEGAASRLSVGLTAVVAVIAGFLVL